MTDVAEIAGRLSEADKAALDAFTGEWQAGPELNEVAITPLPILRELGLIEREFGDHGAAQKTASQDAIKIRLSACWWFRLTPTGLAVRAYLESSRTDNAIERGEV